MTAFPTLIKEDVERFDVLLEDLLEQSGANTALIVEKAGYLIHECGDRAPYNNTEIASLAAASFGAAEFVAERLEETNFTSISLQGERMNTLILKMTDNALLVIIFPANISMTVMRNFAKHIARQIANQIYSAMQRDPANLIDLADLNPTSASDVFKTKPPQ